MTEQHQSSALVSLLIRAVNTDTSN